MKNFMQIQRRERPLVVSLPHTGTDLPTDLVGRLVSVDRALYDTDWFIDELYDFAGSLGATIIRTPLSRTVIDVNRDPGGKSLYPGMAVTELCPTSTFAGLPLYRDGMAPDAAEIALRRTQYFDSYHQALSGEIKRLRERHATVALYDCHSIRSRIPRLFDGELPHINIGTNSGASCDPALRARAEEIFRRSPFSTVTDGRFKGGWITRHYGKPSEGVQAIQVELALRGYMEDAAEPAPGDHLDRGRSADMRAVLEPVLAACLAFVEGRRS